MLKYIDANWEQILQDIIEGRGWNPSDVANKMGTTIPDLAQLIRSGELSILSMREISNSFERDLFVYLLENESKQMLQQKGEGLSLQGKLAQQAQHIKNLEQNMQKERQEHELQVAKLEAKIEAYQNLRGGGFPPTNLA